MVLNMENVWLQFGVHVFVGTMAGGLSDTVAVWMLFNPKQKKFGFQGAILGSIIMAGNASTKHTIKNTNQPVSATIKPVVELMNVRGTAARLENSAYWVAV